MTSQGLAIVRFQRALQTGNPEIAGRGANATWVQNRDVEPHPESRSSPRHMTPVVGKRTELARYTVPAGERILYGQRIDGTVRFLPGDPIALVPVMVFHRGRHLSLSEAASAKDARTRHDRNDRTARARPPTAGRSGHESAFVQAAGPVRRSR